MIINGNILSLLKSVFYGKGDDDDEEEDGYRALQVRYEREERRTNGDERKRVHPYPAIAIRFEDAFNLAPMGGREEHTGVTTRKNC